MRIKPCSLRRRQRGQQAILFGIVSGSHVESGITIIRHSGITHTARASLQLSVRYGTEHSASLWQSATIRINTDAQRRPCGGKGTLPPAGSYAPVVLHDENMNGKLDTNWLGVPKEGYGFSNDARASVGAPSFDDASFVYHGATLELTISLHYR
jgi:uncharacterized protein (DUF2141 family)